MQKRPIIIHPRQTLETMISSSAAGYLSRWFLQQKTVPIDIGGLRAIRPITTPMIFRAKLTQEPPILLIYAGHGFEDSMVGNFRLGSLIPRLRPVMVGGRADNVGLLSDMIIYSFACQTADILGPAAIESGAYSFFGSTADVDVHVSDLNLNAINDISEVLATPIQELYLGSTTSEALNAMYQKIDYFLAISDEDSELHQGLLRLKQNFRLYGRGDIRW